MKKEKAPFLSNEWFKQQFEHTHNLEYNIVPDNIIRWEGLIAPNGDFFSCEFGGHLAKAHYLILKISNSLWTAIRLEFRNEITIMWKHVIVFGLPYPAWMVCNSIHALYRTLYHSTDSYDKRTDKHALRCDYQA